jgi:hypothetical protein
MSTSTPNPISTNLRSCGFPTKVWLTDSERLGPTNQEQIECSVKVTAGKKIRFNVRDSVNPGYEGTAFTDVITISELRPRLHRLRLTVQLQEAITHVSKAVSLVLQLSLCKSSQCMSAYISPPTPTRGSGSTDVPSPFFGTTAPSSPGGILPSPLAEASAALSSQLSLASSIASSTATARNGDGPVNGNAPNSGFGVGLSFALVLGSILGIWGAFILTMW